MPGVEEETIEDLMAKSQISVVKLGQKTCAVTVTLPSGFEITEVAACLDPDEYDEKIGTEIALRKIEDRLWEMEAYRQSCEG